MDVSDHGSVFLVGKGELQSADLVIANILAQPLVELAKQLTGLVKPGGQLVLSGIMSSQLEWVNSAYEKRVKLRDVKELNGWLRLTYLC